MVNKTIKIGSTSIAGYVERDGYNTQLVPVFGSSITTMDGVEHTSVLRYKRVVSLALNPSTQADASALTALLLTLPGEVTFTSLQTGNQESANMKPTSLSASFLSRCASGGTSWNQVESITLEEL